MDIKNNAQATGSLTIKVHLSQRIDAVDYQDNGLLVDWLVEHIREYNYLKIDVVDENLKLDDFTYIPEE